MTRTAIKFGLFVALCTVFTLLLAASIGNTSLAGLFGRGPSTYEIQASFDDVTGLLVNDNVKVGGVPVGKVTGIKVVEGKAKVTMAIEEAHVFPNDSSAAIRWRNLIGQRYVYLFPGTAPTAFEDGAMVQSTQSVIDLGELFNRLGPIVAAIDSSKVNDFLDTVTQALEGNEQAVSQSLDDLAFLVSGLAERDEAIGRLIGNLEIVAGTVADRDSQIQTILTNLTSLSRTFSDNSELLEEALVEMRKFGTDLSALLDGNRSEIDGILVNLDIALGLVEENLGPVETVLDSIDETATVVFNSSRNGEFLNQAILCASQSAPPDGGGCAAPVITGLGSAGAVPFDASAQRANRQLSGADALRAWFGVDR